MTDPYINADALPGLADAWDVWTGADHDLYGCACDTCRGGPFFRRPDRFDAQIPAHRDFLSRRVAELLGVSVGVTAPGWRRGGAREWRLTGVAPGGQVVGLARIEDTERRFHPDEPGEWIEKRHPGLCTQVPSLDAIPMRDPDSDALALAAVARWLSTEIRAGRLVPAEVMP